MLGAQRPLFGEIRKGAQTMSTVELKKVLLANGETIAYRERSGGQIPIVLIHGNMTSSKHWDIVLDRLFSQRLLLF